jgi:hypothetical protein
MRDIEERSPSPDTGEEELLDAREPSPEGVEAAYPPGGRALAIPGGNLGVTESTVAISLIAERGAGEGLEGGREDAGVSSTGDSMADN